MKEEQLKNVSNLISASLDQDKEIMKLNNTIIDLHSVICEKQNEINRLNNIIKELLEQNAKQINSINKAIELIEQDYFEDGSGEYIEQVLSILRGEDNE